LLGVFLILNTNVNTVNILTAHQKKLEDLPSIHSLPYCTTVLCRWSSHSNQLNKNGDL